MNENIEHQLTQEGLEELKAKLKHLEDVERPKNIEDLQEARAQGDLSENADYDAARDEQARIESEINKLKNIISHAVIIKADTSDRVTIGKTVTVKFLNDNAVEEYKLLGSLEANPFKNIISNECPVGAAIVGKSKGDQVKVKTETGKEFEVRIEEIK